MATRTLLEECHGAADDEEDGGGGGGDDTGGGRGARGGRGGGGGHEVFRAHQRLEALAELDALEAYAQERPPRRAGA